MNAPLSPAWSRRAMLQAAGALIVGVSVAGQTVQAMAAVGVAPSAADPSDLDSWIAIGRDGRVTGFTGKFDVGQGVDVAWSQIIGEELDLPADKVEMVMGDTGRTWDQGGVSGSTGVALGGAALRAAAAQAHYLLMLAAAERLGAPVETLRSWDGVISVHGAPSRQVTYAELIGDQGFHAKLTWNGKFGGGLHLTADAKAKSPDQYRVVGKPEPRRDVAAKVFGTATYVTDLRVPGMVHARIVHPPMAGAAPVSVDETSIAAIPGVRIVRKDDFIAVVAPREWDAIKASETLKVQWSTVDAPPFPDQEQLYEHLRTAPIADSQVMGPTVGSVDAVFAGGAQIVEAVYEWPFQAHASMGPGCAVADVRPDSATVWSGTQKAHGLALGCAKLLGRPPGSVRVISMTGPGCYGRNDAGDTAAAAVLLSSIVGKPVRLQGMRHEGTGWDPKGPASSHRARAAIGPDGAIVGYSFDTHGFSRVEINYAENDPKDTLVGQLTGHDNTPSQGFAVPEDAYQIPNRRMSWSTVSPFLAKANPLRGSHLRDPCGPQLHFASESFWDEVAFATGQDPVAMRLRHLTTPRDIAVIKAVADKAGWKPGPPGSRRERRGDVLIGRGLAYGHAHGTLVAIIAEVEVTPSTGRIWPRRFFVAHDCGRIVNPKGIHTVIEGCVVQGASRALFEETTFNRRAVTSVDWISYPILGMADAPESIDIVLLDHPELDPSGAGEPATRFTPAALANAVFDATGVRMRRAPLTPARIKAALA